MKIKSFLATIKDIGDDMNGRNLPAFAASVAFFFFMSFIPMLMFGFSLMKYLPFSEGEMINIVVSKLPKTIETPIESIITEVYSVSGTVIPITLVLTLWTAGQGMTGLIRGLDGILGLEDKRNFLRIRIVSVLYTLALFAFIAVSVFLAAFGKTIADWMDENFEFISPFIHFAFKFRSVILAVFITVLLLLIYTFLPAKRQKFAYQLPGALFSAVGWILMTKLFKLYLDNFNGFSTYGSLTTIIIVLFWLDLIFTIVLMGAYINMRYTSWKSE